MGEATAKTAVITGSHACVNPKALGKRRRVFIEITLTAKSDDIFDKVRKDFLHVSVIQEVHLVSGSVDHLVKARLGEMDEYRRLLENILKKLPVAEQSHS